MPLVAQKHRIRHVHRRPPRRRRRRRRRRRLRPIIAFQITPIAPIALRARAFALASIVSPVVVLFLLAPRVAASVVRSSASVVRLARVVRARAFARVVRVRAFARVPVRRRARLARSRPRRRPRVFVASAVVVVVVVARP
jgi:hypothetical protein